MKHLLEIEVNAEGNKLAYLSPIGEDGNVESGFRIAGPKAWGGSKSIAKIKVNDDDIVRYIKEYAPHLIESINK